MGDGQMNSITYVGLDVHTATVSVAVAEGGRSGEVRQLTEYLLLDRDANTIEELESHDW
jgi:hypothetical protein